MSEPVESVLAVKPSRPLSPHLQIYKPQISSVMSILHRITGVGLFFGALYIAVWLYYGTQGSYVYEQFRDATDNWFFNGLLLAWCWSLFFHMCSGVRHLLWDVGYGLDLHRMHITAYLAIFMSSMMTLSVWYIAFCVVVPVLPEVLP